MLENAQLLNELSRIASAAGREIMAVYARTGDVVFSEKADASPLTEADTRLVSTAATFSTPLAQSGGMLAQLRAAQSQARNTLQALDLAHH